MPTDILARPDARSARTTRAAHTTAAQALHRHWLQDLAVLNLRGGPADAGFTGAVAATLGVALPLQACTTTAGHGPHGALRLVWAGPDDWFVLAEPGRAPALEAALRAALAGRHTAVTDVSGGYHVLQLAGAPVREVLAQGCPLDLHPRAFHPGQSAGTIWFKASVWLWRPVDGDAAPLRGPQAPVFELLVRRSFAPYVDLLLQRTTLECGLAGEGPRP